MLICSLCEQSLEEDLKAAALAAPFVDGFELRADFLDASEWSKLSRFPRLLRGRDIKPARGSVYKASPSGENGPSLFRNPHTSERYPPVILTLRRKEDGGRFCGSESERLSLIKQAITEKPGYSAVDLEEDINDEELAQRMQNMGIGIIRSFHDFTGIPPNLTGRIQRLPHSPYEIPKAAVFPKTSVDLLRFTQSALALVPGRQIVVAMGDYGLPSRILSRRFGSILSYCSSGKNSAAPGHLSPELLARQYRYHNIDKDTAVFGVIGNPIMHSRSPEYHNRRFREESLNAVYLPFLVDDLSSFFHFASLTGIRAVSVTIPHKEQVMDFLSNSDDASAVIGAANTALFLDEGIAGRNTDVSGFLRPLESRLGADGLRGKKATVIGAGGAARAVVYALLSHGASVLMVNRTEPRARALSEHMSSKGLPESFCLALDAPYPDYMGKYSDLIVQTTSLGMEPQTAIDPIPDYSFRGDELVYDIIYTPAKTRFLERAEKAGCRIISGREMFDAQADAQFQLFRSLCRAN